MKNAQRRTEQVSTPSEHRRASRFQHAILGQIEQPYASGPSQGQKILRYVADTICLLIGALVFF